MSFSVARILEDAALNGVYCLDKPSERLPVLDASALHDKAALLSALGWALGFPDYYGANWDGLEECLTDMSWSAGPIALQVSGAVAIPRELLATLVDIFNAAADYWRAEGRSCSLFFSGVTGLDLPLAE